MSNPVSFAQMFTMWYKIFVWELGIYEKNVKIEMKMNKRNTRNQLMYICVYNFKGKARSEKREESVQNMFHVEFRHANSIYNRLSIANWDAHMFPPFFCLILTTNVSQSTTQFHTTHKQKHVQTLIHTQHTTWTWERWNSLIRNKK